MPFTSKLFKSLISSFKESNIKLTQISNNALKYVLGNGRKIGIALGDWSKKSILDLKGISS